MNTFEQVRAQSNPDLVKKILEQTTNKDGSENLEVDKTPLQKAIDALGIEDDQTLMIFGELHRRTLKDHKRDHTALRDRSSLDYDHLAFDYETQGERYFIITEPFAHGGMAGVHKAYDAKFDRVVAIKLTSQNLSSSMADVMRWEAVTMSRINHPNVARIYDFVSQRIGDTRYTGYVMEYFNPTTEPTLASWIRSGEVGEETLSQILYLVEQMINVVENMWEKYGITHNDLKPANMFVDETGDLVIADFGLSSWTGFSGKTFDYASPEVLADLSPNYLSEEYSISIIFLEMLIGKRSNRNSLEHNSSLLKKYYDNDQEVHDRLLQMGISESQIDLIDKVLDKGYAYWIRDRYQTLTEFAQALKDVLQS